MAEEADSPPKEIVRLLAHFAAEPDKAKERPMESQTIELGAATLAALQALVPPPGMTPLAWVALGVGLGQLVLLGVGLGLMYRSNTSREQQTQAQALAAEQRHEETMQRHEETLRALDQQHTATMRALEALIERTAPARAD